MGEDEDENDCVGEDENDFVDEQDEDDEKEGVGEEEFEEEEVEVEDPVDDAVGVGMGAQLDAPELLSVPGSHGMQFGRPPGEYVF